MTRSNDFYTSSKTAGTAAFATQPTVDPMLNIAISNQSLAHQTADLAGMPPRSSKRKRSKSRQSGKQAYMSDFAILNRK